MDIDIGAKRPIPGDRVFVVGHCRLPGELPFVLLYDPVRQREAKRNLQKVPPVQVVEQLGGTREFACIVIPVWGTAWFRASSIRKVVEMSPRHLALGREAAGSRVLFTHETEDEDSDFPGPGFSLYGIPATQAREMLRGNNAHLNF